MVRIEACPLILAFYVKEDVTFKEQQGNLYFNYCTCDCKLECRLNIKAKIVIKGGER